MYGINKIINNELKVPISLWLLYLYFVKRSWLHCNPSNEVLQNVNNIKHYFIESDDIHFEDIVTKDKFSFLDFNQITSVFYDKETFKVSFIYGEKGQGKTTLQNNIFTKYTRELNSSGLSWIRVDASKIYHEWTKFRNTSFIRYLFIQIVYVYMRYYDKDIVFKNNSEKIEKDLKDAELYDNFLKIKNTISSVNSKESRKEILAKDINETSKIAKILLKNLTNSILLIIDGLDNLDYTNGYRKTVTKQINILLRRNIDDTEFSLKKFKSVVIFLREENKKFFNDFLRIQEQEIFYDNNEQNFICLKEYNIKNISFKNLIEKIKNLVLDKQIEFSTDYSIEMILNELIKEYHDLELSNEISKIELSLGYATTKFGLLLEKNCAITASVLVKLMQDSKINNTEIFDFLDDYEKYIIKSLRYKGIIIDDNIDITKDLFFNSYREMLSHAIKSYVYIKTFMQRKEYNKNLNINEYLNRNLKYLLVMEASFKNGNLYGITNNDISYMVQFKNIAFTNLFNIEILENFGILPIEVLIILISLKNNFTIEDADNNKEKIVLEKLEEFGYTSYCLDLGRYSLTKKGNIILEYSFRDINILNTYCYGGIFYKDDITNFKTYGKRWENYISSMLYNVTYIVSYLEKEINFFNIKEEIRNEINKFIYNDYLKADFLSFYSKLELQARKDLEDELKEKKLFNLFTLMLGIKTFKKVAEMKELEFIKMAKQIEIHFENFDNSFDYKILLLKIVYMQNIENILSKYELQIYLFNNYASALENKSEYEKRKKVCEEIKININILMELDKWIDIEFSKESK